MLCRFLFTPIKRFSKTTNVWSSFSISHHTAAVYSLPRRHIVVSMGCTQFFFKYILIFRFNYINILLAHYIFFVLSRQHFVHMFMFLFLLPLSGLCFYSQFYAPAFFAHRMSQKLLTHSCKFWLLQRKLYIKYFTLFFMTPKLPV